MGQVFDGDIIRATAVMSFGVNDQQNTYHLQYDGDTVDDVDAVEAIALDLDAIYDEYIAYMPTSTSFDEIRVWNVTQARPMATVAWPTQTTGTNAGDAAPTQTAPLTLFSTGVAKSQGRKYWPSVVESFTASGGLLDPSIIASLGTMVASLLFGLTIPEGRFDYGNWSNDYIRFAEWTAGLVVDKIKTQRRRALGVGE